MAYKLSRSFHAHSGDVRGIATISDDFFVSTSRDLTCAIWRRQGGGENDAGDWAESIRFRGHEKCVSCVAVCLPKGSAVDSDSVGSALIFTGSHDSTINVYRAEAGSSPIATLKGHKDAVCALSVNSKRELLSASWDKTAKVWSIDGDYKCTQTLEGHTMAVWAVLPLEVREEVVTGGADKLVLVWKGGQKVASLAGHDDCVRALCAIESVNPNIVFSVANDAQLRVWHVPTRSCLRVLYGHTNYVYSMCTSLNFGVSGGSSGAHLTLQLMTGGEDRSARVWSLEQLDENQLEREGSRLHSPARDECQQSIVHPVTSVWCVGCLPNGDLVTGANDGVVRVFTRDSKRAADAAKQAEFDRLVAESSVTQATVGELNMADLPDEATALARPGRQEGQTRLARAANGDVSVYQWSAAASRWEPVGKMVGSAASASPSTGASGKQMYEGREYDYVFSVELDYDEALSVDADGQPRSRSLKLPYNVGENPWLAAQRFIDRHSLQQSQLEEIAQFVIRNSSQTIAVQDDNSSQFVDPFTGAGRYIPGTGPVTYGSNANGNSNSGSGADPFTGGGRYVPGSSSNKSTNTSSACVAIGKKFANFPESVCIAFEQTNVAGMCEKLKQLGAELADPQFDDAHVSQLRFALESQSIDAARSLLTALRGGVERWPVSKRFPLIDFLRVAVIRNNDVAEALFTDAARDEASAASFFAFLELVALEFARPAAASQMLAFRFLANALHSTAGSRFFFAIDKPNRLDALARLLDTFASRALIDALERSSSAAAASSSRAEAEVLVRSKPLAVAVSTCFLNAAVRLRPGAQTNVSQLGLMEGRACLVFGAACNWLAALVAGGGDAEATFRLLVAIGTQLACLLLDEEANNTTVGTLQQVADALLESRTLFTSVAESARLAESLDCVDNLYSTSSEADAAKIRRCTTDIRACLQFIAN